MRGGVPSSALGARNAAHAGGRGGHVAADREEGRRNEGLPGLHEEAEGPRAGSGATVRTQVQYRKSIRKPHGCLNPAFGGKSESRGWKYARFLLPSTGSEWYLAWSQNSVRFRTDSPEEAPGSDQIALRHHAIAGTSSRRSRCGRSCARRRRQARRRSRCRRRRVGPSLEWPVKPSPLAPSRPRALAPSPLARPRSPSRPAQHFVGSSVLSYSGARSAQGRELTAPCACKPCGHGARVFDTALSFFLCRHRPAGPRAASEALSAQQAGQGLRHVPTDAQLARHDQPAQDAGTRTATRARCSHHTHLGHKEEADFSRSGGWDCAGASSGWCWCRRLFPAVTGAGTDTIRFCPISVVKSWATAIAGRLSLSPPTTAPRHAPLSPRAQTRACPAHDRRA